MRRKEWRLRIEDMLGAISEIQAFTSDLDFEAFREDLKTTRAVAYNFVVLGEAARHVPEEIQTRYGGIPWARIKGMRNIVAHEYHRVDPAEMWTTLNQDLPPINQMLIELLDHEA